MNDGDSKFIFRPRHLQDILHSQICYFRADLKYISFDKGRKRTVIEFEEEARDQRASVFRHTAGSVER